MLEIRGTAQPGGVSHARARAAHGDTQKPASGAFAAL
jgi:hypothetical protein